MAGGKEEGVQIFTLDFFVIFVRGNVLETSFRCIRTETSTQCLGKLKERGEKKRATENRAISISNNSNKFSFNILVIRVEVQKKITEIKKRFGISKFYRRFLIFCTRYNVFWTRFSCALIVVVFLIK